ncbi:TNF receptor-associated factor 4-like [Dysidea avara]|uniref:TNF receptor-associated factor 4-like n=1 Tax=Dysidea avara TaxID=196820 RepID=UPI003321C555
MSTFQRKFEYQFVDTLHERYICKICVHPCQDAHLSVCCGYNFCKSCLDDLKKAGNTCPCCHNEEFFTVINKQADREIKCLHVMCTNKERGCEWQGELNDINNHLGNSDGCQFEDVKCSNECGKMLQRQYLTSHVETECPRRNVDCRYCYITGECQFVEGGHKEECVRLPVPCLNKCKVKGIAREDMEAHRTECPHEIVPCEYQGYGCEERMMRKKRKKHEWQKMEDHLLMTKFQLAKTEDKLVSTESRLSNVEVMLHRLINSSGCSDVLVDSIPWCIHLTTMATRITGMTKMCPVIFKMANFQAHKEEGVCWQGEPFFSDNNGYKLSLDVNADGSGVGKGDHLSVFICVMKCPHDDELTWPLRGKFEVKLLNQISDCEHYSVAWMYDENTDGGKLTDRVTDGDRGKGWGCPQFISNEDLHSVTSTCQYLKDDCIFLQVSKL